MNQINRRGTEEYEYQRSPQHFCSHSSWRLRGSGQSPKCSQLGPTIKEHRRL